MKLQIVVCRCGKVKKGGKYVELNYSFSRMVEAMFVDKSITSVELVVVPCPECRANNRIKEQFKRKEEK